MSMSQKIDNKFWKVDLHLHTWKSFDAWGSPARMLRTLLDQGFDAVAVTDHAGLDGAYEMADLAPPWFKVIIGQEIYTCEGEIIGLFLTRPINNASSIEKTIAAIHEQGGLVGIPHPVSRVARSRIGSRALIKISELVDYVEVVNGRNNHPEDDGFAFRLSKKLHLPCSAGSDAHSPSSVGNAYNLMEPFTDPSTFLRSLSMSVQISVKRTPLLVSAISFALAIPRIILAAYSQLSDTGFFNI